MIARHSQLSCNHHQINIISGSTTTAIQLVQSIHSSHRAITSNHLLVFITPRRSPTDDTSATVTVEQQRSSVRGMMSRIGMLLHPPRHNNLTTASSSHRTPIPRSRIINQPSAPSTANLPVRTRKNSSATFIQSTFGPSANRQRNLWDGVASHQMIC
jgi:hypothetical protein